MPPDRQPVRISHRPRRPLPPRDADGFLVGRNVFSSLVAGPAVMASLSAAAVLQHVFPELRLHGFPLAGLAGLLSGWLLAVPVARRAARGLDPARPVVVCAVAVLTGLLWATPAAVFAPAIGWLGGAVRLYFVALVLSASGLVWGGYLNCDAPVSD